MGQLLLVSRKTMDISDRLSYSWYPQSKTPEWDSYYWLVENHGHFRHLVTAGTPTVKPSRRQLFIAIMEF